MKYNIFKSLTAFSLSSCLLLLGSCLLTGCEEDLKVYDESDGLGRVYFVYEQNDVSNISQDKDSLVNYSFVYHGNVAQDTIWLRVATAGFLSKVDRYVELEQTLTGQNDAVAGKHYMSFDDPAYKQLLKVPADSLQCEIPVIVFNDESLQNGDVTLRVRLKASSSLLLGYENRLVKRLSISAMLSKPVNWNALCNFYLGQYGKVKHQFMIDTSGEPWDDDYLLNVAQVNDYSKQDFIRYQSTKFSKALKQLNDERIAQGLPLLAEADGTPVSFPN